jgi:hypothetical protein
MDFSDRINQLASNASKQLEYIQTEEATKNALVMPFIQALGYDIFNMSEVVPEFTADIGIKKGEKVDYAIMSDGVPIILIECKSAGCDLAKEHMDQLQRYFNVTDARFAILTNGIVYRFYSDLDAPNKMDRLPFLEFDIRDMEPRIIEELKKFTKAAFNIDEILSTANELKYMNEIMRIIEWQMTEPDEDIVRVLASKVYHGRFTESIRETFTKLTRRAFRQFVNDQANALFKKAMASGSFSEFEEDEEEGEPRVVTTDEEIEAFMVVRAILREVVDVGRVAMRDTQSYCGILLDDNNRKPICRLRFNYAQKYLGLFDANKNEERVPIDSIDDIYHYAEHLKETVYYYDNA